MRWHVFRYVGTFWRKCRVKRLNLRKFQVTALLIGSKMFFCHGTVHIVRWTCWWFLTEFCTPTDRVHRVPGFLSSRPNWAPYPLTRNSVALSLWVGSKGETDSLVREGVGGSNSDEGQTLWYYIYIGTGTVQRRLFCWKLQVNLQNRDSISQMHFFGRLFYEIDEPCQNQNFDTSIKCC